MGPLVFSDTIGISSSEIFFLTVLRWADGGERLGNTIKKSLSK